MRTRRMWIAGVLCAGLWTCSGNHSGKSECAANTDCAPGQICTSGSCQKLCSVDTDCGSAHICSSGVCVAGQRTAGPQIASVTGDGTPDTDTTHADHHIATSLVVSGKNLEGASAELVGASTIALTVAAGSTDALLTATLPQSLAGGTYTMRVFNQVGSDQTQVTVLQGEPGPSGPTGPLPVVATGGGLQGDGSAASPLALDRSTPFEVPPLATAPASPAAGSMYWDTTMNALRLWDGTEWQALATEPGCAKSPATAKASCTQVQTDCSGSTSGVYWLTSTAGPPYQTYCQMDYDGGGWTLTGTISSLDGIAARNANLHWNYNNARWTDDSTLNAGTFDDGHDHKYASWAQVGFSKLMVVEEVNGVVGWKAWAVGPKTSLKDLFATNCQTLATTPEDSGGAITANNAVVYTDNLLLNCNSDYVNGDDLSRLHGDTPQNPDGNAHYNGGWGLGVLGDIVNDDYESEARPDYGGWSDQSFSRAGYYTGGLVWDGAQTVHDSGTFVGKIYVK